MRPAAGSASEADLATVLEQSLEVVASRCDDLTKPVYHAFFKANPSARRLFRTDERTRGRMLGEIIEGLVDIGRERAYTPATIAAQVKDHVSYGVVSADVYGDLLHALVATMAEVSGEAWRLDFTTAWMDATEQLMRLVGGALAELDGASTGQVTAEAQSASA